MKKYNTIYSFNVIDSIREGKKVYMLDRESALVYEAANVKACTLIQAIDDDTYRFEFWVAEETEAQEEVTE